jgi:hypothetical protein
VDFFDADLKPSILPHGLDSVQISKDLGLGSSRHGRVAANKSIISAQGNLEDLVHLEKLRNI